MVSVKHLVVAALISGAAACAPTTSAPKPNVAQEQVAELWTADTRTVLAGNTALALSDQCSRISPGPVESLWTPGEAEIEAMEDQLIQLLANKLEERGESVSPGDYYRQIAGFVIGGRRVIYVNGLHRNMVRDGEMVTPRDPSRTWRDYQVLICDGGSSAFGVEYDPATRQFSNFAFNGSV